MGCLGSDSCSNALLALAPDTLGGEANVRHPMYVGTIIFVICCPMILGSWWGILPGAATGFLFVFRTA